MIEKLTVLAEMRARTGKESQLRSALLDLVGPTHAEEGCLDYDLHESLDEKGLFWFYENWTSAEALEKHLGSAHLQALPAKLEGLLDGPVRIIRCRRLHAPKSSGGSAGR